MNLHGLADELLEVRRYVRSNPAYVKDRLGDGLTDIDTVLHLPEHVFLRLSANVSAGLERILVNPEILEGYLYGAAAEIREMARRQEDAK